MAKAKLKAAIGIPAVLVLAAAWWLSPSIEHGLTAPKTGTLIDSAASKPVPGGYVVARWYESHIDRWAFGHVQGGGTRCLARTVVQADPNGNFVIPSPEISISRSPSLEYDNTYFWELNVYAPGYDAPELLKKQYTDAHPETSGGSAQLLEPVQLTRDARSAEARASDITQLPLQFDCANATKEPVSFTPQMYAEGYRLACVEGGLSQARDIAKLRMNATPVMAALPADTQAALDAIIKRYYFTAPVSAQDSQQICALLPHPKPTEAHP